MAGAVAAALVRNAATGKHEEKIPLGLSSEVSTSAWMRNAVLIGGSRKNAYFY